MVRRLFYGKKRTEAQRREDRTGWAFMAPFGILFAIVFIIPCCVSPFGFFLGRVYAQTSVPNELLEHSGRFWPVSGRIGAADVFLGTERKVSRMFSLEECSRVVELYLTTPMTTAQVVECLGYPTRQCLERWLAMDPRYAGRMAKPIIPLETRRKAIELVLGGMQQKQAAKQLGAGVGAVHNWVRAYRRGGMAALRPRNQNAAQGGKSASVRPRGGADAGGGDDVEALRRRLEELELENALMREVVEARRKRPRRRPAAPVEQGEDDAGRPAEAEVFAEVDGLLAAHGAEQLPLPPCRDRR